MRQRIFGLENEYGLAAVETATGESFDARRVIQAMLQTVPQHGQNRWLTNGARLYGDIHEHPEYATPECRTPHEAVVHARAGDLLWDERRRAAEDHFAEAGAPVAVHLFRNGSDAAAVPYGSHENYLVARSCDLDAHLPVLLAHLATRIIYTGAGSMAVSSDGAVRFGLSNRAAHIERAVSSSATSSRALLNQRDETHARSDRYRRLHLICGDTNLADGAAFLRLAATGLILRVLEDGAFSAAAEGLQPTDPVAALHAIAADDTLAVKVPCSDGRARSALDIQTELSDHVGAFLDQEGSEGAERAAFDAWRTLLDELRRDLAGATASLEWAVKRDVMQAWAAKGRDLTSPAGLRMWLALHDTAPSRGLWFALERGGVAVRLTSDDEVLAACTEPPRTRARVRSAFIDAYGPRLTGRKVDWSQITPIGGIGERVFMPDPFGWPTADNRAMLDELRGR